MNQFSEAENKLKKDKKLPKSVTFKQPEKGDKDQMKIDFNNHVVDYIKKRKIDQTVTNSIGWVGGKNKIAKQLINMMPKHDMYCEVFFGGGSVFFQKSKVKVNYINDFNSNLVNMYTVMRDNGNDFWKYASYFIYSREIFNYCREKYESQSWNELDSVRRAVIFYFMIRVSFNNNMTHFSKDQKYSIWTEYAKTVKIGEKLQTVCIENLDFREFVNDRLRQAKQTKALFYLDPPYIVAEKSTYYEHLFSDSEHTDLCYLCDKINKIGAYFMLSYEDTQIVRDLYRAYEHTYLEWSYSMGADADGKCKMGKEIIITNFKPNNEQLEIL